MSSNRLRAFLWVGLSVASTAAEAGKLTFKCEIFDSARRLRGVEEKIVANATVTLVHEDATTQLFIDSPVLEAKLETKKMPRWDIMTGAADGYDGPAYFGRELAVASEFTGDFGVGVERESGKVLGARIFPPFASAHKNLSAAILVRYHLDKKENEPTEAVLERCGFDASKLQSTLGFKFVASASRAADAKVVGFDIDDTLLWSEPAFRLAKQSKIEAFSPAFWRVINQSDKLVSRVKRKGLELVRWHKAKGARVVAITKRIEAGQGEPVRQFIADTFGIDKKDVFFEPGGKVDRIKNEKVTLFYGDSDGDIEDAERAGATGVRFLRSPHSTYRGDYNAGKFGEEILVGSYDEL